MYGALFGFILGLLTRIKNQPHGKPNGGASGQEDAQAKPCSVVVTYAPPPLTDKEISQKEDRESREKSKFKWEKAGLVVLILYTGFTAFTYWEIRKTTLAAQASIQVARDAIRLQQRPWVGIDDTQGAFEITPIRLDEQGNAHIGYDIRVRTFNNSAAQNVLPIVMLMITSDIEGIRAREKTICSNAATTQFGNVVFPGRPRLDAQSSSLVQRSEMQTNNVGKFQGWLVGCIGYRDSFGYMYHTGFIYWLTDPRTRLGIQFDVTPNTEVTGHWATWSGSID